MGSNLVALARRYVALSDELESVRDEIKRAVLNGAGETPKAPFTPAAQRGDEPPPSAKMIDAAANEARIIETLRQTPGMGATALAVATSAKKSTTAERLRRLRAKGQVEAAESGGWSAV